jgi:hypothetical protein
MSEATMPSDYLAQGPSGAVFSECRTYRYMLWRRWKEDKQVTGFGPDAIEFDSPSHMVAFIGLNPSTADETQDDPTIRRCIGFAKSWGFRGMMMLNLFAFRATDPKDMKAAADPIGPDNDRHIRVASSILPQTICCWGTHGAFE